ncbi:hypothetical protein B0J12DRAFT_103924 [Macrophomina phaseolina]|uniref:Uncharacterized protein n=1 Tax=Macrophomina phaseolina TaxID=35725 RepID=A0ABQ8GA13_9PEZI|nr:hypothetical protein B0J12DRAFT_103924 [Macrophomina phaseolina]
MLDSETQKIPCALYGAEAESVEVLANSHVHAAARNSQASKVGRPTTGIGTESHARPEPGIGSPHLTHCNDNPHETATEVRALSIFNAPGLSTARLACTSPHSSLDTLQSSASSLERAHLRREERWRLLRPLHPEYDEEASHLRSAVAVCGPLDSDGESENPRPAPARERPARTSLSASARRRAALASPAIPSALVKPEKDCEPVVPKLRGGGGGGGDGGDPTVERVPAREWFLAGGIGVPPTYATYRAKRRHERAKGRKRASRGSWKDIIHWGAPPLEQTALGTRPPPRRRCCFRAWCSCSFGCGRRPSNSGTRSDQQPVNGNNDNNRTSSAGGNPQAPAAPQVDNPSGGGNAPAGGDQPQGLGPQQPQNPAGGHAHDGNGGETGAVVVGGGANAQQPGKQELENCLIN